MCACHCPWSSPRRNHSERENLRGLPPGDALGWCPELRLPAGQPGPTHCIWIPCCTAQSSIRSSHCCWLRPHDGPHWLMGMACAGHGGESVVDATARTATAETQTKGWRMVCTVSCQLQLTVGGACLGSEALRGKRSAGAGCRDSGDWSHRSEEVLGSGALCRSSKE